MKWHVYHINCDCAAYNEARRYPSRARLGIRCSLCYRILGPMQYDKYGVVDAETAGEAVRKAVECKLAEQRARERAREEAR